MKIKTADLYDEFGSELEIAEPLFESFGRRDAFGGAIATVKVFEDNVLVKETLGTEGDGRVLVVDGGGSLRCALLGDKLATMARHNGWAGIIVFGSIRDSVDIDAMDIGIKALATCPAKSVKRGEGTTGVAVRFAGVLFEPDHFVYSDADGIVVASRSLLG